MNATTSPATRLQPLRPFAKVMRRILIALFPAAVATGFAANARADAGAELKQVQVADFKETVARIYDITRGEMDTMGVSQVDFFEVSDARNDLDVLRAAISKLPGRQEFSLQSWCREQGIITNAMCARIIDRKHKGLRYSAFAKSLITRLDDNAADFYSLRADCLTIAETPANWLGGLYSEFHVTGDYYSVDVMISVMVSDDLRRAVVAYYDAGA